MLLLVAVLLLLQHWMTKLKLLRQSQIQVIMDLRCCAVDNNDETAALPYTMFAQPIASGQMGSSNAPFQVVGYLVGLVAMESYLFNLLPSGVKGITMVISNTCGEEHSFLLGEERVSRVR